MDIETPDRPFWLKAAIILVGISAFFSVASVSENMTIEDYVASSIGVAILVPLLIGLIFNSLVARWITIVVFGTAFPGGLVALIGISSASPGSYFSLALGGAMLLILAAVTVGFTFSKNVHSYYKTIRSIREAANANPDN